MSSKQMTTTLERPAERTVQALVEQPAPAPRGNVVALPPLVPKAYPPKIAKALLAVSKGIGAVGKHGENTFHHYHYQKWEDVLNKVSELLVSNGLIIQQSEVSRSLFENDQMMSITYAFTIINEDGEVWPDAPVWSAIARARDQKGVPDDKSANKCHTQAHKYFLLHLFKIRTKETVADDSDGDEGGEPTQQHAAPGNGNGNGNGNGTRRPPRPGSEEAKRGTDPCLISPAKHNSESWVNAFIAATDATEGEVFEAWCAMNRPNFERLNKGDCAPDLKRLQEYIAKKRGKPAAGRIDKPPAAQPMPDPATDKQAFIGWVTGKLAAFTTYEDGETWWNDIIDPLDMDWLVHEDAMACFQAFEKRFL